MAIVLFSSRMKEEKLKQGLKLDLKISRVTEDIKATQLTPLQHSGSKDYIPLVLGQSQPV